MFYVAPEFLTYRSTPNNLGGISSIRLGYSTDIVQQRFQTDTQIDALLWKYQEKYVAGWQGQYFEVDVEINDELTEMGFIEGHAITAEIEAFCTEKEFHQWWIKCFRGRRFFLELTNYLGNIRILNPFQIQYRYLGKKNVSEKRVFQLTFIRDRIIINNQDTRKIIRNISSIGKIYLGVKSNDVTINVLSDITASFFNFGYSLNNDLTTVIYQNDPTNNILINVPDGTYYFFAIHQNTAISDVMKASIIAGQIEIIISEIQNPQIITENETSIDEGIIMPE